MQENFSIFTKNLLFVLQVRKTHSGIDQMSLISESVQNCILETPEKWYKGDPRVCSVCLLHALNTVAVWHYLEKKICAVCPSISDAEYIRSVLRQKVYGLIKFNITR